MDGSAGAAGGVTALIALAAFVVHVVVRLDRHDRRRLRQQQRPAAVSRTRSVAGHTPTHPAPHDPTYRSGAETRALFAEPKPRDTPPSAPVSWDAPVAMMRPSLGAAAPGVGAALQQTERDAYTKAMAGLDALRQGLRNRTITQAQHDAAAAALISTLNSAPAATPRLQRDPALVAAAVIDTQHPNPTVRRIAMRYLTGVYTDQQYSTLRPKLPRTAPQAAPADAVPTPTPEDDIQDAVPPDYQAGETPDTATS